MWTEVIHVIGHAVDCEYLDVVDSVHSTLELALKISSVSSIALVLQVKRGGGRRLCFVNRPAWRRSCFSRAASGSFGWRCFHSIV